MGYEERRRLGDVRKIDDHYTNKNINDHYTNKNIDDHYTDKGIPTKRRYGLRTVPPIGRVMTINGYIV